MLRLILLALAGSLYALLAAALPFPVSVTRPRFNYNESALRKRANPCFVTGSVALAKEVADSLPALESTVTCVSGVEVAPGVPDVTSGGIKFSSIDFRKAAGVSPLGFALKTFTTPDDPADADLNTLQSQLNDYLAFEAGVRSQPGTSALLGQLKGPKFFLQFQIARVQTAQGASEAQLGAAGTVEHQLGKVVKNAVGASKAEIDAVNALATQV
ncbi:hypothetical protein HGRIS_010727 [Hohenbuehelia grisea]|uniref:DUF7143 domain-containing protein n=1 Tax=Hohenbuehelia grisea TaxID=104357 RepID=A0ABR3IXK4_9AGAR